MKHFEEVVATYGAAIARLAGSYERIPSLRDELVQEILLALWRALPTFRGECSERTFVYRIAHNRCLNHAWRRRPIDEPLDAGVPDPPDPRPQPDEAALAAEQRRRLHTAIASLSLSHRQVVVLLLEGLSHAEIGEVLGISENNAAVRANRARAALREALGKKEQA